MSKKNTDAVPIAVRLRTQRMPGYAYVRDPRASLPRLDSNGHPAWPLSGVPDALRDKLYRNLHYVAFPYPRFLEGGGELRPLSYPLVEMETDAWRLAIAPSFGGRIFSLFDKSLNRELLYLPPALRMENFGLGGAWFVGGLEFNAFRFGHNIFGNLTLRTEQVHLAGGQTGIRVSACDELFGCSWSATIVPLDAAVAIRIRLHNHSDQPQPGYWWTNIATPADTNVRIMAAPGPVLHHGAFRFGFDHDRWPMLHGRDWSQWLNHHEVISAYLYQPEDEPFGYVDDTAGFGLAHWARLADCRGRKIWSIGAGYDKVGWWRRLSEPAGPSYYELQIGRDQTQLQTGPLPPRSVTEWTELLTGLSLDEPVEYARFSQTTRRRLGEIRRQADAADFWRVGECEMLVEADPRVELSRRVLHESQSIRDEEIEFVVRDGWVGGAAWVQLLEERCAGGRLSRWGLLALGAAQLDQSKKERVTVLLNELRQGDDEPAGWAEYLLALNYRQAKMAFDGPTVAQAIVRRLPHRPDALELANQLLLESGRLDDAEALWCQATPATATSEQSRLSRAQIAFCRGQWQRVRELMREDFFAVGEANTPAWLLRREADLAEAFALASRRRYDEAQVTLARTAEEMPQFGAGRNESWGNLDVLFYRWWIAVLQADRMFATHLAQLALRVKPPAGTVEAVYCWHLADLVGDSRAVAVKAALERFDAEAGREVASLLPLREVVRQCAQSRSVQPWRMLLEDPLWSCRANFELTTWSDLYYRLQDQKES